MQGLDLWAASEIGDGSGQFENTGEAARREAELVGDLFEQFIPLCIEFAEAPDMAGLHLAVGMEAEGGEALMLNVTSNSHYDFLHSIWHASARSG